MPATSKPKTAKIDPLEKVGSVLTERQKRFAQLWLGHEDGKSFGNSSDAYLRAYYGDGTSKKDKDGAYTPEYNSARANGARLLANANIRKYIEKVQLEVGFKPETIKRRFSALADQNKNLPVALAANDKRARIAGVIRDEAKVDIPQLEALGSAIKTLLTPAK